MSDHVSTQKLISTIERKDRRFRAAQIAFMVILVSSLVGIIIIQVRTLAAVNEQLSQQKRTVTDIKRDNSEQLGRLNRHLDCIVAYFGQTDRANLTIEDINKCTIKGSDGAQEFFLQAAPPPTAPPSGSPLAAPPATPRPTVAPASDNRQVVVEPTQTPSPTPSPSQPGVVRSIIDLVTGLLK